MQSLRRALFWLALPFGMLILVGCSGSNIVPVTGTLTYKGHPVPGARVLFVPAEGRMSVGDTDDQGHFELDYDGKTKGAVLGKHLVSIQQRQDAIVEREPGVPARRQNVNKDIAPVFEKYNQANSKKYVEITKDTKVLDLNLD